MSETQPSVIDYAGRNTPRNRQWPFISSLIGCSLVIGLLLGSLFIPAGNRPRINDNGVACASNLGQIGQAMLLYADDNNGENPDTINALAEYAIASFNGASMFCCRSDSAVPATGPTTQAAMVDFKDGGNNSYTYVGSGTSASIAPNQVLAYEPLSNHGDGMNVLLGDGTVQYLSGSDARAFNAQIASGISPLYWPTTQPIR